MLIPKKSSEFNIIIGAILKFFVCELYGKLRTNKEYSRHPNSLYDMYGHLSYSSAAPSIKKMCNPQLYDILTKLGAKYTLDVKYIPAEDGQPFYQLPLLQSGKALTSLPL